MLLTGKLLSQRYLMALSTGQSGSVTSLKTWTAIEKETLPKLIKGLRSSPGLLRVGENKEMEMKMGTYLNRLE